MRGEMQNAVFAEFPTERQPPVSRKVQCSKPFGSRQKSGDRLGLLTAEKQSSETLYAGVRRRPFNITDNLRRRRAAPRAPGQVRPLNCFFLRSGFKSHSPVLAAENRVSQNGQRVWGGGSPGSDPPQRRQHRSRRQCDNLVIGDQRDEGDGATGRWGDGEWFSFSPCLPVSLSRYRPVAPSPRRPVFSRSPALGLGQYAEGYVLQYAVADDQQAFFAEFSRHRAEDHLAQFDGGLIEFRFLSGLSRVFLLKGFTVRRLIAGSEQFLNAASGLIDFLSLKKRIAVDRIRGDQP